MSIITYNDVEILRNEVVVLRHVNLEIKSGEFVYLIGKVGSGKSSLMKSMYAEVPVAGGTADVLGYNLNEIKRKEIPYLRRKIGIVFQDFQLLTDRSVFDNLKFVLEATGWKNKDDMEQRIDEVLKEVGMATKAYKMPHELSGGEQQRIVIARALLNKPELILADEPTGNLDPTTSEQIVESLHEISKRGTTVVMATHNLQIVQRYAGRVITCDDKQVIEQTDDTELDIEQSLYFQAQ
ncbi:MAG: ATP-binding cassette domain-containing protein [Bacteroides sp.]|nr:ATP-binding cassette domain-containing protein [Bacteroidales bacterium]MBD5378778.1 ATP-binding cassette domain-containing protein [Bacteroides sp.]MDE5810147.1 ATP-binding cassette domain-containing protein [Muribaculaceae bacterium]